jgi:23S rRNA pseudouridine1911/1915/1917 synthase
MADYRVKIKSRLLDFLQESGYTRTKIKQLLKHRALEVNGSLIKSPGCLLKPDDIVTVRRGTKEPDPGQLTGLNIIHEDDSIIVVEKSAGLLTIASETEKVNTAYYRLNEFLRLRASVSGERIFIVHRLDRDTSGLLVFAKTEGIKRKLQENWNGVEKRYHVIVEGKPKKAEGEVESRLNETKSLKVYSDPHSNDAKLSKTRYRVMRSGREYSLLEVLLETGRKNQIRVHLSDIGHPVAGDKKYGAKTNPLKRLGLHAYLLSFKHPVTGELLRFKSKMPRKFSSVVP